MGHRAGVSLLVAAIVFAAGAAHAFAAEVEILSVSSRERVGTGGGLGPDVSADGRKVVFTTSGDDLARNSQAQVLLRDRRRGTTRVVSRSSRGRVSNHGSFSPQISPNGRFVAWCSYSDNLVKPDRYEYSDIIPEERYVDVFVRDLRRGVTRRASTARDGGMANDWSCEPHVANTGDVVFGSRATNLVRRDRDDSQDVFVYDWGRRSVRMTSVRPDGRRTPHSAGNAAISPDGSVILFGGDPSAFTRSPGRKASLALLHFRRSRRTVAVREPRGIGDEGACGVGALSRTARFVLLVCKPAWSDGEDTIRGADHLYRFDRRKDRFAHITPISIFEDHSPWITSVDMTQDGRFVTWCTNAMYDESDRVDDDVFVADVEAGTMERVVNDPDRGAGTLCATVLPEGGRSVVFQTAFSLVRRDDNETHDVYLRRAPFERP